MPFIREVLVVVVKDICSHPKLGAVMGKAQFWRRTLGVLNKSPVNPNQCHDNPKR